jgi:hypothetical protein
MANTLMVNSELFKPQELFLCGLVDPVTKILFRFTFLPKKTLRFTPRAVCPSHIVDFDLFRL